jgi:hypothetical protein
VPHAETRDARYIVASSTPFGLVAWAQKGSLRGLSFSLQVRDVSRAKLHSGTELPVVPESEFRESVDLLNVPIEPSSARTALRIYTLDTTKELPVRIAISPAAGGDPLVNDTVVLQPGGFGGAFQSFAFFSSLDDLATRYPVLNGAGPVQITVSTASKTPIWAFSAITNNDTQLITTVVPH